MRSDTLFKFDNTFEVWTTVVTQDDTGQIFKEYVFSHSGKGLVVPSANGFVYLATRQAIDLRAAVRKVRDRNGVSIFTANGSEYDMYVTSSTPQYDALGSITGWNHVLQRELKLTTAERLAETRGGLA